MRPSYVNLVLSGGGQRCIAFVGFLRSARKRIAGVRNVYCVSGGAVAGLAFCLGVDDDAVVRLASRHIRGGVRANLGLLITRFGLDDVGDRLGGMLVDMICEAFADRALRSGDSTPPPLATLAGAAGLTFAELAKATGKNLVVHAASVVDGKVKHFSVDETPGASVVDAVCASCAVPFFFCPVRVGDDLLIDGCLAESYPFGAIVRGAASPSAPDGSSVAADTLVLSAEFDAALGDCDPARGPGAAKKNGDEGEPHGFLQYGMRLAGILAARSGWGRPDAAHMLGPRATVFRVNAACDVTAARVMCEGLDPAAVTRLYRAGLDEGHRFLRQEE